VQGAAASGDENVITKMAHIVPLTLKDLSQFELPMDFNLILQP